MDEAKPGTIKLRINLNAVKNDGTTRKPSRSSSPLKRKTQTEELGEKVGSPKGEHARKETNSTRPTLEALGEASNENTNSDSNIVPLRLKLRLKAPIEDKKPKIVLSLKESETKNDLRVDIETVEKPSKRRRTIKDMKSEGESQSPNERRPNCKHQRKPSTNPYSTIAAVKPTSSITGPKVPLPSFRSNMTRVPIAALSSFSSMTPGEREEERLWRQSLAETLGSLWQLTTKPNTKNPIQRIDDIIEGSIPYWLMLSPIDSAMNAPTLRSANTDNVEDKLSRVLGEYKKLKDRFDNFSLSDKNKEIATELLVLEQKLSLEEEKFLFAKLKSDYNAKVVEIMAKKRKSETFSAAAAATISSSNRQRILPKIPGNITNSSWTTGPGINVIRGNPANV